MREILRPGLPIEAETPWGIRRLRPPTVREALGVLLSAEEAAEEDAEARHTLYAALRTWLPLRLYSLFTSASYPVAGVAGWAVKAVEAAAVDPEALRRKSDEPKDEDGEKPTWRDLDWTGRVADYAHAYSMAPTAVLDEPFSAFTLWLRGVERVEARADLRALWVQGLPYQDDDRKREASLRAKQEAAGYEVEEDEGEGFEGLSEEEALERQREILKRMNRRLGREG